MANIKNKSTDFGLEKRKEFLFYSLLAESYTSIFLGVILGITDIKGSKTLGNKSSSFSFSQKADLLLDMNVLNKYDKTRMIKFMEIRNQFMHNLGASSYVECISITGAAKFLTDNYVDKAILYASDEHKFGDAALALANDVINITFKLYDVAKEKFTQREMARVNREGFKAALHTFGGLDKILTAEVSKIECLKKQEAKELVRNVIKAYAKHFANEFAKVYPAPKEIDPHTTGEVERDSGTAKSKAKK